MRARVARAFLALCAALSLVAPAHLVHYLAVQHDVCSEHGELVHADGGEHAIVSAAAARAPGAAARAPGVEAAPQSHEHEHCAFATPAREALALPPAHAAATLGAASSHALPTIHADAVASEALFRLAPKTSPPA